MKIRTLIFWLHLITGITAGLVILVMSVTGVLLTYEKQMVARADRSSMPAAAVGATRLPIDALVAQIEQQGASTGGNGGASAAAPSAITLRADPAAPASVSLGRGKTVLVNPYTGDVLGDSAPRLRAFFRSVTEWHRWLALTEARRATGKAVTGACNLAFLFLVVSGFYLWWPRAWRWNAVKAVTLFGRGLRGKARDWNWHNVIGFWSAVPLLVIVASGAVISYPWASDLVYRAAGETPPARGGGGPGGPGGRAEGAARPEGAGRREGAGRSEEGGRREGAGPRGAGGERGAGGNPNRGSDESRSVTATSLAGVDAALVAAQKHTPDWQTITLQLPRTPDAPLAFTVDRGAAGQPQKRGTLTIDRATATVTKSETFESQSPGRRLRSILRFAHTGEVLGLAGQTIAGLASAGAAVLVYTGFALTWRRFRNRRRRGDRADQSQAEAAELEPAGAR
jgi:uncharacterized iron-regulated membrane protein